MALVDEILDGLEERDGPVRDVRLCLRATAVRSRRLGLAYAFPRDPLDHGAEPRALAERTGRELAELARSRDPVEASVGVAAINSLLDPPAGISDGHALDLILENGRGLAVALVGHFPFADRLRAEAGRLDVLELNPREGDRPAADAPRVIPRADVVAITASTLVNGTLEGLLDLARGKVVILIGPTSPFSAALFARGVSAICGSVVVDPEAALRDVSEGVSFRRMRGLRRVIWRAP
jgi:uncharacterized protein (DUF4213/DUF364 family)